MGHGERDEPNVVIVERGGGGGGGAFSFLVGAAVGAVAALLFAPYAGSETRRRLSTQARALRDRAEETLEDAWSDARHQIDEGLATAKDLVDRQANEVRDVIEAGRAAARETRRELRRRHGGRAASSTPADAADAEDTEPSPS